MCSFVISILVKPARAGWEKIPAARSVVLSEWRTSFEYRSWGKASHLLNSSLFSTLLWIHPHLASPLFNCGHHFSSQLFSGHLSSPQFFSQLFSTVLKFVNLLPPQLNSYHLFPPLLNSSHRFSPLPTSSQLFSTLPSSQLISTLLTSPHLFSTLFNSPQFFQLFPTLSNSFRVNSLFLNSSSPFLTPFQLWSTLLSSSPFFPPLLYWILLNSSPPLLTSSQLSSHVQPFSTPFFSQQNVNIFKCSHCPCHFVWILHKLLHAEAFTQRSVYRSSNLLHRETFKQRSFYREKLLHREAFT